MSEEHPADAVERRLSIAQTLLPVLGMVVFLGVGSGLLGLPPHGPLLWSLVLTGLVGRFWVGVEWSDLTGGVENALETGLQAILILFLIYALVATWVSAGTIPGLMYYGLGVLTPAVFLPTAAILAFVVAVAIGSSWTTAGTLGIAFVGIGSALGIPTPMTAGAVLSGAYAGDKQSPLSDTTNLAAAVTDTDLYDHIRGMRWGTLVAFGLSLVVYAWLGLAASGAIPAGQVEEIRTALAGTYDLSVLVFLPLAVTFGLALWGRPALPTLVAGVFAGVGTTMLVQGVGFTATWDVFLNGTGPETGVTLVDDLLASGGLSGSAWTVSVVVLALSLGGLLQATGVLGALARGLTAAVSGQRSLVAGTGVAAFVTNFFSAQQYMSIVVPGMTLGDLYEEYGLESRNLSRAVEAVGTPTGALLPWHAGGVYMMSVFGVGTAQFGVVPYPAYAPYYLFAFFSPLVFFVATVTGLGVERRAEPDGAVAAGDD
ncbi:arginine/ornithine antiporter ArcD [Halomarina oriensis]|uniref:Arginine:ornithine antiporter n=1 Tax=Halomarina oriensis TaxID=671145 RepID=A0A6B0GN71_9EURY|nr:Na+/H+ antiporter NhaC family protein [Halomarina oriensis]MWG36376.1 arginine:ornithine antiporter [Halomarina oriensis]